MTTELIACPRCGANPAGAPDVHGQYVCAYCGSLFRSRVPVARPVQVPPPTRPVGTATPAAKRGSSTAVGLAILGAVVAVSVVGGIIAAVVRQSAAEGNTPGSNVLPTSAANQPLTGTPSAAVPEVRASATFVADGRTSAYQEAFYVLGFVTNTSPFVIDKPKVTAVLLDKAGKEVATRDGYAECDSLGPKATAPIKLLISDPPIHDHLKFEVVASKASYIAPQAPGLRLEIGEAPHPTFGTSWTVTGKVFNDGQHPARFVNIQVLAFDVKNHLVGLDSAYVDGESVAPGASGRFRAMPMYDSPPHHFKFEVAGRAPN